MTMTLEEAKKACDKANEDYQKALKLHTDVEKGFRAAKHNAAVAQTRVDAISKLEEATKKVEDLKEKANA